MKNKIKHLRYFIAIICSIALLTYFKCPIQKELVKKHDKPSITNIADKMAGHDSFHIFEILITLGKACVEDIAEKRPEMVVVYMNLQNILSSKTSENNGMCMEQRILDQTLYTSIKFIKIAMIFTI